jgi:hypothetical protein
VLEPFPLDVEITAIDWRSRLAAERLLDARYEPRAALDYDLADRWPGDFTGRLLAAQIALEHVRPELAERADALAALGLDALRTDGVLGPAVGSTIDEQQVSGHGWLVAALLSWARKRDRPDARAAALRIVDAVLLPALERLDDYPVDADRTADGEASGHRLPPVGRWMLSTDTFCVLIGLEGLVAAYRETREPRYLAAIDEAARFVRGVDLVASRAQLLASLTAARCLLAAGRAADRSDLADVASEIYAAWSLHARTLDSQTWNWFGRADSWTEPCAVVDALELAWGLWEITGRQEYIEDWELIRYSGLAFAQNAEGGFSLSSVATSDAPTLAVLEHDAYWCCTMRGAWGLAQQSGRGIRAEMRAGRVRAILDSPLSGNLTIALPSGPALLQIESSYPESGPLRVTSDSVEVELWTVEKSWSPAISMVVAAGSTAEAELEVTEWARPAGRSEAHYRGPQLLARMDGSSDLSPIADRTRGSDASRSILD